MRKNPYDELNQMELKSETFNRNFIENYHNVPLTVKRQN